jgi:hypothetical protein
VASPSVAGHKTADNVEHGVAAAVRVRPTMDRAKGQARPGVGSQTARRCPASALSNGAGMILMATAADRYEVDVP